MCAILNEVNIAGLKHNLYTCGGSLIAPNVILTAAHCFNTIDGNATQIVARCGEWDTQDEIELEKHQDVRAKEIKFHPGFVKGSPNLHNDFAIVILEDEFILDKHIDTICLPNEFERHVAHAQLTFF